MANQKNAGARTPKQDKSGEAREGAQGTVAQPTRSPDAGAAEPDRDRASRGKGADGSVISNDDEVELGDEDVEESMDDDESDQITGRHPSQRDRDLR